MHFTCEPVCQQACIHGVCTAPNTCNCSTASFNGTVWGGLNCNECNPIASGCSVYSTCINVLNSTLCTCVSGYVGSGQICDPVCSPSCIHGQCLAPNKCACTAGWTGPTCSSDCHCPNSSCINGPGFCDLCPLTSLPTPDLFCTVCSESFHGNATTGNSCLDIDYCALGLDDCDPNADCIYIDAQVPMASHFFGSFLCTCRDGYAGNGSFCVPVCLKNGCVKGSCVAVDTCLCEFGYYGADCSAKCPCNNHGSCSGLTLLSQCGNCTHNTSGTTCNACLPGFFGNALLGSPTDCKPCSVICNNFSNQCVPSISLAVNGLVCFNCTPESYTMGSFCNQCIPGYFKNNASTTCEPCQCNGHGVCAASTGVCSCTDNTFTIGTLDHQCNSCISNSVAAFVGDPRNGHFCYEAVTLTSTIQLRINAKLFDHFNLNPSSTDPSLDISITFDIFSGVVDCYITGDDNLTFNMQGVTPQSLASSNVLTALPGITRSTSVFLSSAQFAALHGIYFTVYAKTDAQYSIYMMQHSSNINLFVFFSAFFSGFFLLVSISIAVAKGHRIRSLQAVARARVVEIETMALRPKANIFLNLQLYLTGLKLKVLFYILVVIVLLFLLFFYAKFL